MPAGDAARGFPKVASEIQGALSQSRSGLQNVAEELTDSEKQNAKRAQLQSLVQRAKQAQDAAMARAKHGKMYRYVEKANRMMATLSRQLPRKDAEMFPKEAHELNQVFGAEMKKLGRSVHSAPVRLPKSGLLAFPQVLLQCCAAHRTESPLLFSVAASRSRSCTKRLRRSPAWLRRRGARRRSLPLAGPRRSRPGSMPTSPRTGASPLLTHPTSARLVYPRLH